LSQEPESQSFARQTKKGGVVSCDFFDDCGGKVDGLGCIDCRRNQYSKTKTADNYIPIKAAEVVDIDDLVGVCEFGEVRIHLASDWKNCHVFLNGKLNKDIGGLQIMAGPNMITQCQLIILKPKGVSEKRELLDAVKQTGAVLQKMKSTGVG